MSTAIVAVPDQMDPVWKVSSEKIPHLTLLFLGETTDEQNRKIADFLKHAVSQSLSKFGLLVTNRGVLGPDKADVLFVADRDYGYIQHLKDFRHHCLQNRTIQEAYHATEQWPDWVPHITLGYPERPAKTLLDSVSLNWIQFNKIFLWTGDFEGVEFPLKDDYSLEVAMSDLSHYGVKGMQWGVRKDKRSLALPGQKEVTVVSRAGRGVVKTSGGRRAQASDDAATAAAVRQKAKASRIDSVSNKDLQTAITRMNLERQFNKAVKEYGRKSVGRRIMDSFLGANGNGKKKPSDLNKLWNDPFLKDLLKKAA